MIKKLYVFIGEMGTGKTTIVEEVSRITGIPIIRTTTSRPKRESESSDAYNFVDATYFEENKDKFIETREYKTIYGNWYYGLEYNSLTDIDEGLVILTPQGYKNLISGYNNIQVELFYVYCKASERIYRIISRGDNICEIQRRIIADNKDFENVLELEPVIVDNNFNDIKLTVENIVKWMR